MEPGGGPPLPEILREEEEEERVSNPSHSGLNNRSVKTESHTCFSLGGRGLSRLVQNEILEEAGPLLLGGNSEDVDLPVVLPEQALNLGAAQRQR